MLCVVNTTSELELSFNWEGLGLAGALHLPAGGGPHPAVLMAQGSGPADRDSGGYFCPIRQTFLDQGIATFAFDKPGCGASAGDWRHYGLDERADQLVGAIELIRGHETIDSERVGIWGHSQGGWLVQRLARTPTLAFAIASSAPSISVQQQILYDVTLTIRNRGHGEEDTRDAIALTKAIQNAAAAGVSYEAVRDDLLAPASRHGWYEDFPAITDVDDWRHLQMLCASAHDPVADLERVACPFLALYGGLDELLPPWRGAKQSGKALAESPCDDATVVVFPTGDHRLQDDDGAMVPGYLNLLGDWAATRCTL